MREAVKAIIIVSIIDIAIMGGTKVLRNISLILYSISYYF
jgi:hypothetical protein